MAIQTELQEVSRRFSELEASYTAARDELHTAIVKALRAGWGPSRVEKEIPYDRQHIDRIRRKAGIPARRKPTVQRIPKGK